MKKFMFLMLGLVAFIASCTTTPTTPVVAEPETDSTVVDSTVVEETLDTVTVDSVVTEETAE